MSKRRIFDNERHAHFLTFSCYKRRRLLDHDRAKKIVVGTLGVELKSFQGYCIGFVVMPNHVHAIVWFSENGTLSKFMKQWKQTASLRIQSLFQKHLPAYLASLPAGDAIWQPRYYDFNLYTRKKIEEKLAYMHNNPVRAGLVKKPCDWPWSSARHYELGKSVGIPIRWIDC